MTTWTAFCLPARTELLDHVTLTVSRPVGRRLLRRRARAAGPDPVVDYLDPEDEDEAGIEAVGYGRERRHGPAVAGGRARRRRRACTWPSARGRRRSRRRVLRRRPRGRGTGAAGAAALGDLPAGPVTAMLVDPDGNMVEAVARRVTPAAKHRWRPRLAPTSVRLSRRRRSAPRPAAGEIGADRIRATAEPIGGRGSSARGPRPSPTRPAARSGSAARRRGSCVPNGRRPSRPGSPGRRGRHRRISVPGVVAHVEDRLPREMARWRTTLPDAASA